MNIRTNKPILSSGLKSTGWFVAVVMLSASLALFVTGRAPALELFARDWLMRARGSLSVPDDIVIVAIDEASLKKYGRFPWSRVLMAEALERLRSAVPRAIALDVLYTEKSNIADDQALVKAIER